MGQTEHLSWRTEDDHANLMLVGVSDVIRATHLPIQVRRVIVWTLRLVIMCRLHLLRVMYVITYDFLRYICLPSNHVSSSWATLP